ncbi:MAG: radical SAM protein [Deltaproteobacteria bacterium]|nr:radical SAM protein [Deltaproteobacteria bacterium]
MDVRPSAAEVAAYLDKHLSREPGTKIQYGHPSPRFWAVREAPQAALLAPMDSDKPLNLYLHIPFCPPTDPEACGFCLFAREDYHTYKAVDAYVADLLLEVCRVAQQVGRRSLRTLYFGGGTPNLLSEASIRQIFACLRHLFEFAPGCEISFEGTPGLFTPGRLEALHEVGVNRISVGAQVLKQHLIKYSGRTQRNEHIQRTVEFCRARGIHCSVDLITGWFEQTPADVVDDVRLLHAWGVDGIVNHPLTLGGDSVFAREKHNLPPVEVSRDAFLAGRATLLELGYRSDSYTDYCRADQRPVQFLEMYRDALHNDRLGVGYGANSLFAGTLDQPGHAYRNVSGREPYHARLEAGRSAVESIFDFNRVDLQLIYVLKGLEGCPWLDADAYARTFGSDLAVDFAPWWQVLADRGWLAWNDGHPRLQGDGIFYTSEVQRCLSEPRNAGLRRAARLQAPNRLSLGATASFDG